MVGVSLAVCRILVALVQAVLTRIITPVIGNERSVYLGLVFYAAGLFLFAFATKGWQDVCLFSSLLPWRTCRTVVTIDHVGECAKE